MVFHGAELMLTCLIASATQAVEATSMNARQSLNGREKDLDRIKGLTTLAHQLIQEASELMARKGGSSSTKKSSEEKERDLDRVEWLKTLAEQLRQEASELESKWSHAVSTRAQLHCVAFRLTYYS